MRRGADSRIQFSEEAIYSRKWLKENPDANRRILLKYAGTHPLCLCTTPPVPMYIAKRATPYLATMPGRTHHHSELCPHFEPDESTTGRSAFSSAAIQKFRGGFRVNASYYPTHAGPDLMSSDALLQLLWETAGLNHWSPRMVGKRNSYVVSKALSRAASRIWLNSRKLSTLLLCPSCEYEIEKSKSPRLAMLSRVQSLFPSEFGFGMRLEYCPEPLWFSRESVDQFGLTEAFGSPLPSGRLPRKTYALVQASRTNSGNYRVIAFGSLMVSDEFIPLLRENERASVDTLIRSGSRFYRCLPYGFDESRFPKAVVYSLEAPPKPLFDWPNAI